MKVVYLIIDKNRIRPDYLEKSGGFKGLLNNFNNTFLKNNNKEDLVFEKNLIKIFNIFSNSGFKDDIITIPFINIKKDPLNIKFRYNLETLKDPDAINKFNKSILNDLKKRKKSHPVLNNIINISDNSNDIYFGVDSYHFKDDEFGQIDLKDSLTEFYNENKENKRFVYKLFISNLYTQGLGSSNISEYSLMNYFPNDLIIDFYTNLKEQDIIIPSDVQKSVYGIRNENKNQLKKSNIVSLDNELKKEYFNGIELQYKEATVDLHSLDEVNIIEEKDSFISNINVKEGNNLFRINNAIVKIEKDNNNKIILNKNNKVKLKIYLNKYKTNNLIKLKYISNDFISFDKIKINEKQQNRIINENKLYKKRLDENLFIDDYFYNNNF